MTPRTKTLLAIALGITVATSAGLAWVYTRPVVTAEEEDDLRARAARLAHPSPDLEGASVAPPIDCTPYVLSFTDRRTRIEDELQFEARHRTCAASFEGAWDHLLASPDDDSASVTDGGVMLVGSARREPATVQMETLLRTLWSLDSLVRSGRTDLGVGRQLGLEWTLRSPRIDALTEDEAVGLRAMSARVRQNHPHRLHRPELLALWFLPWEPSEQSLDWVCTERVVVMAEALAGIGCDTLTTRACFDRVNETIDALDRNDEPPAWVSLLPPRSRRQWDADCEPLTEPLHELVTRAVESEIAFSLIDELLAHSVDGGSLEAAMSRPTPTFEGEALTRRRTHDALDTVVIDAPAWTGGRGEPVLTLVGPADPSAARE